MILYNSKTSTCENALLVRDRPVSALISNLQILVMEVFRVHEELFPADFQVIF